MIEHKINEKQLQDENTNTETACVCICIYDLYLYFYPALSPLPPWEEELNRADYNNEDRSYKSKSKYI